MKEIHSCGLFATHNQLCAIRDCDKPAVLEIQSGLFQPCWNHYNNYKLVNIPKWIRTIIRFFNGT